MIRKTAKIGYYFSAFIDVVGQRDRLKELTCLPRNETEKQKAANILLETSEYIKELRKQFAIYFEHPNISTGILDRLTPEQRKWAENRKKGIVWYRGFSDSYIVTIPCWYESQFGVHIGDIFSCLYGICALSIWALAMEKPFRGGVEIGLGTEIDEKEVYGAVTARSYDLENREAGYPRIVVGEGLVNHLQDIQSQCSSDLDGRHTLINVTNCQNLITIDEDKKYILDFLGAGVKSLNGTPPILVKEAYGFVIRQYKQFADSNNVHLFNYYSSLRKYFESKLFLW